MPVNVFQANGVTSEQAQYLFSPSNTGSRNRQTVYSAYDQRRPRETGHHQPVRDRGRIAGAGCRAPHRDAERAFGDAVAQQGGFRDSDGRIAVNEGYGELEVPLVQDRPFFHDLTINGAARYSAYKNTQGSTGFGSKYNVWTYKGELTWSPVRDIRVRASYNHAIRAPNIGELFAAQSIGNVSAQDPCSGADPGGQSRRSARSRASRPPNTATSSPARRTPAPASSAAIATSSRRRATPTRSAWC